MTIGEELRSLRLSAGLTQEEMAAGFVSESFYSRVERGVHAIDADTLIRILIAHQFDVITFFARIANQQSSDPIFELISQITFAQNRKDVKALDKIVASYKQKGEKIPERVQFRLELAYAWARNSSQDISIKTKNKFKKIIYKENWDRTSYNLLSQGVIFLDVEDAKQLITSAFKAYREHPMTDVFTLQIVSIMSINYLNCCYHQHASKEDVEEAFKFLHDLPIDPAIGLYKILGNYYEALFDHDSKKVANIIEILKDCGFLSVIEDTIEK